MLTTVLKARFKEQDIQIQTKILSCSDVRNMRKFLEKVKKFVNLENRVILYTIFEKIDGFVGNLEL